MLYHIHKIIEFSFLILKNQIPIFERIISNNL